MSTHGKKKKKSKRRISSDYQEPEFIEIVVTDPVTHEDATGKPTFTDYLISVETNLPEYSKKEFSIRRRFSEFAWLKNHLRDQMEDKGKRLSIAELPGNTLSSWLGLSGRYEKEFIEERRKGLQVFMVSVVNHPWARFEEGLHKFLEDEGFDMS
eukprot:TRINITY_DN1244_c0_g1_i1.p2 TRINITY_DN1244_c0_g1~~TRINITY_DN1244_c0_g1_i1.p2  ORF type:complete len:154 (-),score=45.26 TRINITY_DN1244_c0_g1_i1:94-555(-)